MTQLLRRLQYLLNRRRFDAELAADMEFHREMAAREGRRNLGNSLRLREQARDAWGWTWIDRLGQDLRYAARVLRKSPGFTAVAVLTLALGIGVNVAAFGFFDLMFLRPLPVRDPATILHFVRSSPLGVADNFVYPEVAFYREHAQTLSSVLALSFGRLSLDGAAAPVNVHYVTANFFSALGAAPAFGRLLDAPRDEAPDADPVVVLSYRFWQRQFGADVQVIGRTIRFSGKPATVIGVAGREFSGLGMDPPNVWAAIAQEPYFAPGTELDNFSERGIGVFMWGRLAPGLAPPAAETELRALAAVLHHRHPNDVWANESLPSQPGAYGLTIQPQLIPVLALVGTLCLLILIMACGNLGSLLLARAVARKTEIAIRVAVGAGRVRLLRQLITESFVLACLGFGAGLVMGYAALRGLIAAAGLPPWVHATPDWRTIAFAAGVGLASTVLFGLMPSWQAARQRYRAAFLRQIFIGVQVAAGCVLLIVAGLEVRALNHAIRTDPGFDYRQVITIDPALTGYTPARARVYFAALKERLRALPGVESVALASNPPLGNRWTVSNTTIAGRPVNIHINHVDPAFLPTMQIPILRGRNLSAGDAHAAVVSDSLARVLWPSEAQRARNSAPPCREELRRPEAARGAPLCASSSEDPIGKTLQSGSAQLTVVGISRSARLVSPEDSDAVEVYVLAGTDLWPSMSAIVRTAPPPEDLVRPITAAVKSIDPQLLPEVQLMKDQFRGKIQTAEYAALAVSVLGFIAQFLACLGIVGVVAYAVTQRTKEIGIRMALGAKPANILPMILSQFSRPLAAGLVVGVAGAAGLSRLLRWQLYGVSNLDLAAYLGAIGVFVVTAAIAALWPARKALRVDPMRALHYE